MSDISDKRLSRALHYFLLQTKLHTSECTSDMGRGWHYVLMNPVLIYTFQVSVSKWFFSSHYPKSCCEHYSISTTLPLPLPPLRTQHVKIQKHPLWSPHFFLYVQPRSCWEVKCCRHRSEHTLCHQTQQPEPWQLSPCKKLRATGRPAPTSRTVFVKPRGY